MKKRSFELRVILCAALFAIGLAGSVAVSSQSVSAHDGHEHGQAAQQAAQATSEERKEVAQAKLADAKLKACENREKAITNIMARIADRGQKQLDLFDKIAERTEAFYVDKGKTLASYDQLIADVDAKKTAAQDTVDTIKSTSTTFDCSADNPKAIISSFKESLKNEIEALKAYKTSVKNLIVGVKSVQGTTSSSESEGE